MKQYSTFHFSAYSWNHPAPSVRASRSRDYAEMENCAGCHGEVRRRSRAYTS